MNGRKKYIQYLTENATAKGGQVNIFELVAKCRKPCSTTDKLLINAQWKYHREKFIATLKEQGLALERLLVLADVSGSMDGYKQRPMNSSIAIAIMVAEIQQLAGSPFGGKFLSFTTNPEWVMLPNVDCLYSKVQHALKSPWGGSTNILKAFEKIMEVGIKHRLNSSQMPDMLAIISDMQFNCANHGCKHQYPILMKLGGKIGDFFTKLNETSLQNQQSPYNKSSLSDYTTTHQMFTDAYRQAGLLACGNEWTLPLTLYWNVAGGRGQNYPVQANTPNTIMLAGYNFHTLQLILNGEDTDTIQESLSSSTEQTSSANTSEVSTMDIFKKAMADTRYDSVRETITGPLSIEMNMEFDNIPNKESLVKELMSLDLLL